MEQSPGEYYSEPHFAKIDIQGSIKGECFLSGDLIGDSKKFTDSINYHRESEWYDPYLRIKYVPVGNVTGDSIIIKYEIW